MAKPVRIATFASPLSRNGPGVLLRDIVSGDDPQIATAINAIEQARPDIILLTDFDYDLQGAALTALSEALMARGLDLRFRFADRPNTGVPTGSDLDGNGYLGDAADAQGFGMFPGDGGMAILSRFPIDTEQIEISTDFLWRDLPAAQNDGIPSDLKLATTAFWQVPVATPEGTVTLLAYSATPPVFDGPEDRNGRRNADETTFWARKIAAGEVPEDFVLIGNANLDPAAGDGDRAVMARLLADPHLNDPLPDEPTAFWPDGPGQLRVSYILPSQEWTVVDAAVQPLAQTEEAGPHRLVWVDIVGDTSQHDSP